MHLCFIFVETSAVHDHVCFQFGVPAFIPTEKYGPAQASQPSALPHVQPPNRLYARYTATSIPFQYINPHAGAATGTNSDENGAARFPFSATMGLREANYKAR